VRVLVLAPHTDDGEFGCGASIARFIREGHEVFYAAFSVCEQSVPYGLSEDILESELRAATTVLGMPADRLFVFRYAVRHFPTHRQEILEDMIQIKRDLNPDLVFLPSPDDIHQDHSTIAQEGTRAFKMTSILGYEIPWNNLTFATTSFIFVEEADLDKKVEALMCYKSQSFRHYASEDFLRGLARARGTQIGAKYAEAFHAVRWILK
jgi:LmbE family N-acetylglucosaminyl deacetylase